MDIGRCFNDALDVYKRNWLILAVAALLFEALSIVSLFILTGPLAAGVCLMTLRAFARDDRTVDLADMFECLQPFLRSLALFYVMLVFILIGLALCVLPGLALMTFWLYPFYLVADKDTGFFDSLRISKEIVNRKGFWPNLFLVVVQIAFALFPNSFPAVGWAVSWFVIPIAWLVVTSAYIQQVHEDTGELADLFTAERVAVPVGSPAEGRPSPSEEH